MLNNMEKCKLKKLVNEGNLIDIVEYILVLKSKSKSMLVSRSSSLMSEEIVEQVKKFNEEMQERNNKSFIATILWDDNIVIELIIYDKRNNDDNYVYALPLNTFRNVFQKDYDVGNVMVFKKTKEELSGEEPEGVTAYVLCNRLCPNIDYPDLDYDYDIIDDESKNWDSQVFNGNDKTIFTRIGYYNGLDLSDKNWDSMSEDDFYKEPMVEFINVLKSLLEQYGKPKSISIKDFDYDLCEM